MYFDVQLVKSNSNFKWVGFSIWLRGFKLQYCVLLIGLSYCSYEWNVGGNGKLPLKLSRDRNKSPISRKKYDLGEIIVVSQSNHPRSYCGYLQPILSGPQNLSATMKRQEI